MKKTEFKKLIRECIKELIGTPKVVNLKSLKPGDLVMYNEQGPFEVVSITPDRVLKSEFLVKVQIPNVPEKWAEFKADGTTKYFTKINK